MVLPLFVSASLDVYKVDKQSVIISELNNPATFEFDITNNGSSESAEMYSFVGVSFVPNGTFNLASGLNKIDVTAQLNPDLMSKRGYYYFEYEIKGANSGITGDKILVEIRSLKDLLSFETDKFNIGDSEVKLKVTNTKNINLTNLNLHFNSIFFDTQKTLSFAPYESKDITLKVNKEGIDKIESGNYVYHTDLTLGKVNVSVESSLNYLPREEISSTTSSEGFIIRKSTYTRTNVGNVVATATIQTSRDVLSRLYTINSIEPVSVKRNALYATYTWEKNLNPGESYSVTTTTNYTLPFIFILLVIVIALLVKAYTRTNMVVNKKVSYVKTRGGEFALKVTLSVKAKKYVENIQVIDRLPGMTQLYEKFGIRPDKIDAATKRLFWNIDRLNSGEERVYSYIIYSKVNVVGRFELPSATAVYQRDGNTEQILSNRTFFVAETTRHR